MKDNYGQSIQRSLGSILRVALAVLVCLTLGALSGTGFQASAQNRSASKTVKIKGSVIDEDSKRYRVSLSLSRVTLSSEVL